MSGELTDVCGRKPVLEVLDREADKVALVVLRQGAGGPGISAILDACRAARVRFKIMPAADFAAAYPDARQGVVARLAAKPAASLEELARMTRESPLPVALCLDQVSDPGNAGVLARTLVALGGGGLLVAKHNAALLGPGAMRSSAGAMARLSVARETNLGRALDQLSDQGFNVYCASLAPDSENVFAAALAFPAVLVLGGEDKGVRPGLAKRCRARLAIPLPGGFDSLNVAQAGAVILGQFAAALARRE